MYKVRRSRSSRDYSWRWSLRVYYCQVSSHPDNFLVNLDNQRGQMKEGQSHVQRVHNMEINTRRRGGGGERARERREVEREGRERERGGSRERAGESEREGERTREKGERWRERGERGREEGAGREQ